MDRRFMNDGTPIIRKDLEYIPIQHGGQQLIFIRDHLGLVQEGKALPLPLYQLMIQLDGTRSVRDLQMELMRQRGGVLVSSEEVTRLIADLDEFFLLDSEKFRRARDHIVETFRSKTVRPCSHCGRGYPDDPSQLKERLNQILALQTPVPQPGGRITALLSPHIDLSVGQDVYSSVYQTLRFAAPSRVVLLGVAHQGIDGLFCLTEKDFETPLGIVKNEPGLISALRESAQDIIASNDFAHRSEHSIEFQLIFLQHLLEEGSFTIIPILCGFARSSLSEYSRNAYLEKAKAFLEVLRGIVKGQEKDTLLVAGVDFSHIGPKFGHDMPAEYLKGRSESHDKALLQHLSILDANGFWEESGRVQDQFNVCGFSALACLLEVIPPSEGKILGYKMWYEEATRSAVSFAAAVFTSH